MSFYYIVSAKHILDPEWPKLADNFSQDGQKNYRIRVSYSNAHLTNLSVFPFALLSDIINSIDYQDSQTQQQTLLTHFFKGPVP